MAYEIEARPVGRRRLPGYPTKLDVLDAPELLAAHLPPIWRANREIAAAAGVLLAASTGGCRSEGASGNASPSGSLTPNGAAIVAPVFEHGRGRVSTGCVAITPPALLTESEALQIISEELAQAGVNMTEQYVTMPDVLITGHVWRDSYDWVAEQTRRGWQPCTAPLVADLKDPDHAVAIEFITRDDCWPLGGEHHSFGTAGHWDFPEVARNVAGEVKRQGRDVYFGAFYEPAVYPHYADDREELEQAKAAAKSNEDEYRIWNEWRERCAERSRRETTEQLRAQVHDFVAWLKGQGAI